MTMFPQRQLLAFCCVLLLSSCSAGEEGTTLPVISFQKNVIAFNSTGPDDSTPPSQTLSGTFNHSAIYMAALTEGTAVERVNYSLAGKVATISVQPKSPAELGPGMHSSRITVFGQICANSTCSQLATGPAEFINVSYAIPQVIREVSPYVVQEQSTGSVIIHGAGFGKFTVNGVTFGGFPASGFSVVDDTRIQATYPPLATGRYGIQIQASDAPVQARSDAELVVIAPTAFVATTIPYPTPAPAITRILYDAERNALLLVTSQNGGELLRFRHAGDDWSVADVISINALRDIALTANGRFLLAVTDTGIVSLDAESLATVAIWDASLAGGVAFSGIAVTNDGSALLTTTAGINNSSLLYFLDPRTGVFASSISLNNAIPVASGDGSQVVMAQQDATGASTPSLYQYVASSMSLSAATLSINRNSRRPALDHSGTRLVLNGLAVYDGSYTLVGTLPDTTLATVLSPDGTRVYGYDSAAASVLAYDTVTATPAGAFLETVDTYSVGTGDPGSEPGITISPAGDAVFVAGLDNIMVIPVVHQ